MKLFIGKSHFILHFLFIVRLIQILTKWSQAESICWITPGAALRRMVLRSTQLISEFELWCSFYWTSDLKCVHCLLLYDKSGRQFSYRFSILAQQHLNAYNLIYSCYMFRLSPAFTVDFHLSFFVILERSPHTPPQAKKEEIAIS